VWDGTVKTTQPDTVVSTIQIGITRKMRNAVLSRLSGRSG